MPTQPTLEDFAFTHTVRVRWTEVDATAIAFNSTYLVYFDLAITEFLRATTNLKLLADLFLVRSNLEYRRPARFDDELTLGARVVRIGRTGFTAQLAVFRGADLLVDGNNVYVHAPGEPPTPARLPDDFVARVRVPARPPTGPIPV
jgi:acyl-CoA thioester hydrolase